MTLPDKHTPFEQLHNFGPIDLEKIKRIKTKCFALEIETSFFRPTTYHRRLEIDGNLGQFAEFEDWFGYKPPLAFFSNRSACLSTPKKYTYYVVYPNKEDYTVLALARDKR